MCAELKTNLSREGENYDGEYIFQTKIEIRSARRIICHLSICSVTSRYDIAGIFKADAVLTSTLVTFLIELTIMQAETIDQMITKEENYKKLSRQNCFTVKIYQVSLSVYVCVCVCGGVCVCVCVCMYIYMCIYLYKYIYIYTHI
jgi:uncharacterized membrane protein